MLEQDLCFCTFLQTLARRVGGTYHRITTALVSPLLTRGMTLTQSALQMHYPSRILKAKTLLFSEMREDIFICEATRQIAAYLLRISRMRTCRLTNVNNDHTRCAQGVPCGGHAWSYDGLTFSNLTIGAFGPVIRFQNGSFWYNAYVERPQVLQAADGTPIAFYVGMGRSSYEDCCNWAQVSYKSHGFASTSFIMACTLPLV